MPVTGGGLWGMGLLEVGAEKLVTWSESDSAHCGGSGSLDGVPSTPGTYAHTYRCLQCCGTGLRCICCTSLAASVVVGGAGIGVVVSGSQGNHALAGLRGQAAERWSS